jgi:arylformamidase
MISFRVTDWDQAYANSDNIAGGDRWPHAWVEPAANYRATRSQAGLAKLGVPYGDSPRHQLDLFFPDRRPHGLVIFVHGGYWLALDKSYWSHLARGCVGRGYAVAIPSYTLCPDRRISGITAEVAEASKVASGFVDGDVRLVGHSAGGHLVTRMICTNSPLPLSIQRRVVNTVSISGLHDLRPIMKTSMNKTLSLDNAEAAAESPALDEPMEGARITCWVGAAERSEFVRQSALLANVWSGLGAETAFVQEPDRHHFDVIDGLLDPEHPMVSTLLR